MAIAEAQLRARFGPGIIDHMTYAFVGDGCLQEGVGQEVISLAGHLRLGHLVFVWDSNKITDDGPLRLVFPRTWLNGFALPAGMSQRWMDTTSRP